MLERRSATIRGELNRSAQGHQRRHRVEATAHPDVERRRQHRAEEEARGVEAVEGIDPAERPARRREVAAADGLATG
jgi:hypothetical protein